MGPYRLIAELGRGPLGTVWRARDPLLERDLALRLLDPGAAGPADPGALARWREGARRLARLRHPAAAQVLAAGEEGGRAWLASDLVEGEPLRALLARGPLHVRDSARLALSLARGLAEAHGLGLVHADLRVGNVLVCPDGEPVMTDLGLALLLDRVSARVSLQGEPLADPATLAPEQVDGAPGGVGPWTDVHALGGLLAEALGGVAPFAGVPGEPAAATRERVLGQPPRLERARARAPRLADLCARCLRKRPETRPALEEVARELGGWLAAPAGPGRAALVAAGAGWLLLVAVPAALWVRAARAAAPQVEVPADGPGAPDPDAADPEQAWRAGVNLLLSGELRPALAAAELALTRHPDHPLLLALAFAAQLELQPAGRPVPEPVAATLERALARDPGCVPAQVERAALLLARGELQAARPELERLLSAPGHQVLPPPTAARALLLRARLRLLGGEWEGAAQDLGLALEACPEDVNARCLRGRVRAALGDLTGAGQDLEQAQERAQHSPVVRLARAAHLRRHGDQRGSLKEVEAGLRLDPQDAGLQAERAAVMCDLGEPEGALAWAERALERAPGETTALAARADARVLLGDPARAEAELSQALERAPREPDLWAARARARRAQGDRVGAGADLRRVLELLCPQDPEATRARRELEALGG